MIFAHCEPIFFQASPANAFLVVVPYPAVNEDRHVLPSCQIRLLRDQEMQTIIDNALARCIRERGQIRHARWFGRSDEAFVS